MEKTAKDSVILAIGAHPDDIEFMMGGTLLLLRDLGAEIYFWNLARGDCGTASLSKEKIVEIRRGESLHAAKACDAEVLPPVADDLMLFYEEKTIRRVAAGIRKVQPDIVLTLSPQDYMEDHQNASRLAVTAAFARGMRNLETVPSKAPISQKTAVYHALPYGLHDQLKKRITPDFYTDITEVIKRKREMLSRHKSQKEWLDVSQGMDSYLNSMEEMSARVGEMSQKYDYAEGWRQHLHLGLCGPDDKPLQALLGA